MANTDARPHTGTMSRAQKKLLNRIRLERLPRVIKAYLQGTSVRDIAKTENVTAQTIYGDIRYARKMWLKKVEAAAEEYLTDEIEKLNLIEAEAWTAWEKSKTDAVERAIERDSDGNRKRKQTRKGQCGDKGYLEIALKCIDKRCRMLKIGEYGKEESLAIQAKVVEVVVESVDQVNRILDYGDYEDILSPSEN